MAPQAATARCARKLPRSRSPVKTLARAKRDSRKLAMTAGPTALPASARRARSRRRPASAIRIARKSPIAAEPRAAAQSRRMKQAPMLRRRPKAAIAKLRRPIAPQQPTPRLSNPNQALGEPPGNTRRGSPSKRPRSVDVNPPRRFSAIVSAGVTMRTSLAVPPIVTR